jgi:hypothetical protein
MIDWQEQGGVSEGVLEVPLKGDFSRLRVRSRRLKPK